MVFSRILDKILFRTRNTPRTQIYACFDRERKQKKLHPIRETRVQKTANLVLEKAVESSG